MQIADLARVDPPVRGFLRWWGAANVVRAVTDARNVEAIGVLERVGFQRSRAHQAVFKGEPCTEFVYVYNRPNA